METTSHNNSSNISGPGGNSIISEGNCNNNSGKAGKRGGCGGGEGGGGLGKAVVGLITGSLVYYHCAYRNASLLSLASDVLIVLLCSLAILGLLFRQLNISVPVDPLEWRISQETANGVVAWFANTVGAAESVLRVAATGHDKRLFFKVVFYLYMLSALGRLVSGATVAYAALCLFCLYMLVENSQSGGGFISRLLLRQSNETSAEPESM